MLSDCRHPRFRNLNSTVPVDVVRLKSYVDSLLNYTRVPVRVSVNKRNLVPERITPGLIGVFRIGRSSSSWKPCIPIVLLNQFMNAPSDFANVYFALVTRNLIHCSILFSWVHRILRSHWVHAILVLYRIWKQVLRHAVVGNDEEVQINVWCLAEPL